MKNLSLTVLIVLVLIMGGFCIDQRAKAKKAIEERQKLLTALDSTQNLADSLSMELFPASVELSRYQVAFEIFARRNPTCAEEYGNIISEETE